MQKSTIVLTLSKKKHTLAHVETMLKALRKIGISKVDFFSDPRRDFYELVGMYSDTGGESEEIYSDNGNESEEQSAN
jgi:hypothetical protein